MDKLQIIKNDAWHSLKKLTNARIALGSAGVAIPQNEVLNFKLAHAQTKDAIKSSLAIQQLKEEFSSFNFAIYEVKSAVVSRNEYLKRPDLGRKLDKSSYEKLKSINRNFDLVFVLADGLSADGVNENSFLLVEEFIRLINNEYNCVIVLASQARVAIGDEISSLLSAHFSIVLIGERPGLSSPKSMGVYTTFKPRVGLTDERRNCISNIHKNGLKPKDAAKVLKYLFKESLRLHTSGVKVKLNINKLLD